MQTCGGAALLDPRVSGGISHLMQGNFGSKLCFGGRSFDISKRLGAIYRRSDPYCENLKRDVSVLLPLPALGEQRCFDDYVRAFYAGFLTIVEVPAGYSAGDR